MRCGVDRDLNVRLGLVVAFEGQEKARLLGMAPDVHEGALDDDAVGAIGDGRLFDDGVGGLDAVVLCDDVRDLHVFRSLHLVY